jgi:hypothetical protein
MKNVKECSECDGRGWTILSCCGDDITFNIEETDICPTCYEHCGDDKETCEACDGEGYLELYGEDETDDRCRHQYTTGSTCLHCGHINMDKI